MNSCLYEGWVRHRRRWPEAHVFCYPLFLVYLDLGEIEASLGDTRWVSAKRAALVAYRRSDYLGDPALDLAEAVRQRVVAQGYTRPAGPIRLLTNLRYWGTNFNPVSFYFCYDAADREVETIVADINNTPWDERFAYVLAREEALPGRGSALRFSFAKQFHVSPFWPMDHTYRWLFTPPGERLVVHMENFREGEKVFDASLVLSRRAALGPAELLSAQWRHPLMGLRVLYWIYLQASRLFWKKTPFYPHPGRPTGRPTENLP